MAKGDERVEVEVNGIKVKLDLNLFYDYDLYVMMASAGSDVTKMVPIHQRLFGDDYARITDSLRNDDGFLDARKVDTFVSKAIKAAGAKNS